MAGRVRMWEERHREREREGERDTTISHQINGELGRRSRELIQTALVWVYKVQYEEYKKRLVENIVRS